MCNIHYRRFMKYGDWNHRVRRYHNEPNNCGASVCPVSSKINSVVFYRNNADDRRANTNQWRSENPDKYQAYSSAYHSRDDVKKRKLTYASKWNEDNRDRFLENLARHRNRYPERASARDTMRRLRKLHGVNFANGVYAKEIEALYAEACRLKATTGIRHEVDHIEPLVTGVSSGLHVPWNLRVVTREVNQRRKRKWTSAELTEFRKYGKE
jgi:predicted naringenin-chalcone synthase